MFTQLTLIIDATGDKVKIALAQNNELLKTILSDAQAIETVSDSVSNICENLADIKTYAIATGPGSVLGTRFASAFISVLAKLHNADIYEFNVMQVATYYLAKTHKEFSLLTPSRKGCANIINFENNSIVLEKEIEIADINSIAKDTKILLHQREKIDASLANFEKIDTSATQIFNTLKNNNKLLHFCENPPDAKSLAKREYVKWKAQAHI